MEQNAMHTETAAPAVAGFVMPPDTPREIAPAQSRPFPNLPAVLPVMPPEIAKAMMEVCREVKALRLDGTNTHDNYRFTSIDVFLETVGGWCAEHGLMILPEETSMQVREVDKYSKGQWAGRDQVLYATYRFWLVHESGAIWQHPMTRQVSLRAGGPQAYGSAESYVLKRFLRALFKIPTGDVLDPGSDSYDPDAGRGAPPPPLARPLADSSLGNHDPLFGAPGGNGAPGDRPGNGTGNGHAPAGNGHAAPPSPDDGLFQRSPPTPPAVTGRMAPARSGQAPLPQHSEPPPPRPLLTGGQTPFRVLNAAGEVVAEYRDLKAWGEGLKRHLSRVPVAYGANLGEIDRLEDHFLADPALTPAKRKGTQAAFEALRALAPRDPAAGFAGPPGVGFADHPTAAAEEYGPAAPPADQQDHPQPQAGREPGEEG